MRRPVLLAIFLTVAVASPAFAYIPEQTPHRDAEAAARAMLAEPATRGASAGIVILRNGREIFSVNGGAQFAPASVIKLATTTTAMVKFGPDHRFATRALSAERGPTIGTLYLVGGGDPTLANEANRWKWFVPKPTDKIQRPAFASGSPTIEQLAARIARAGVTRITGGIVADDTLFDAQRKQAGWLPRYFDNDPETGLLSALEVNEGFADLDQHHLLPSPALGAGQALANALASRGITVGGGVSRGRSPQGLNELARVESPPLAELIDFTNRYSINFDAELMLKSIGAAFGGVGSTTAGVQVIGTTLRDLGVPTDGLVMTDGSGLSVLDRVTPRTVARLLEQILTRQGAGWDALRESIPVAGRPGTLMTRLAGPPTGGNLRGKTGQIEQVRAMAGWVTARDAVPLVYVAIFNHTPHPFQLTAPLDIFGLLLALYPG